MKKFFIIAIAILSAVFFFGDIDSKTLAIFRDGMDPAQEETSLQQEGMVYGTETVVEESPRVPLESVLPIGDYKPVRKDGYSDLIIPTAHAALILDANSGTILQYQNGKERRSVASLTKIMTAVMVLEEVADLSEPVTITSEALNVDGTVVGCPRAGYCMDNRMFAGEKIAVRDLMTAMLINSTNDAAKALAIHVSGSETDFVQAMNARTRALGLQDTHFCTASGLEPEGREHTCYSTAYDIARITAYALQFPIIWDILQYPPGTIIYSTDGQYGHELLNTNELLGEYPGLLGTKTGYTPNAGRSLLAVAQDATGLHKVITVLLDDPYRWSDVKDMIGWAFSAHSWQ